jgi:ligand-binding SRPBCC domain-containing protein
VFSCGYQRSVRLSAPIEKVFAFHLDPANLRLISPPWTPVARLTLPPRLIPGARVDLEVRVFGLVPQQWVVEITTVEAPTRLVDTALTSPFRRWRHTHAFRAIGATTEMTDSVEYDPPLGFLGRWFDPVVTRPMLAAMFRYRHTQTADLLKANQLRAES